MLQHVTACYRVLQSVTECYRVFLAHLFGPISGLVDDDFDAEDDYDGIAGRGRGVVWVW